MYQLHCSITVDKLL